MTIFTRAGLLVVLFTLFTSSANAQVWDGGQFDYNTTTKVLRLNLGNGVWAEYDAATRPLDLPYEVSPAIGEILIPDDPQTGTPQVVLRNSIVQMHDGQMVTSFPEYDKGLEVNAQVEVDRSGENIVYTVLQDRNPYCSPSILYTQMAAECTLGFQNDDWTVVYPETPATPAGYTPPLVVSDEPQPSETRVGVVADALFGEDGGSTEVLVDATTTLLEMDADNPLMGGGPATLPEDSPWNDLTLSDDAPPAPLSELEEREDEDEAFVMSGLAALDPDEDEMTAEEHEEGYDGPDFSHVNDPDFELPPLFPDEDADQLAGIAGLRELSGYDDEPEVEEDDAVASASPAEPAPEEPTSTPEPEEEVEEGPETPDPSTIDSDGDGLVDSADGCPNEPEDIDLYEDADGCPDPDNDSDGIADAEDECPVNVEDADGWKDDDGCPDFDNDQDGISDFADLCPDQPETLNEHEDEDGCPDELPEPVEVAEAAPEPEEELASVPEPEVDEAPAVASVPPTEPVEEPAPAPEPEEEVEEPSEGGEWTSGRVAFNGATRALLLLDDGTKVLHRIVVPETEGEYEDTVELDPTVSPNVASVIVSNTYERPQRVVMRPWNVPSDLSLRIQLGLSKPWDEADNETVRGQVVYTARATGECWDVVDYGDTSYPCAAYRLHLRGLTGDKPEHLTEMLDFARSDDLLKEEVVTLRRQLAAAGSPVTTDDSCNVNLESCSAQLSAMAIELARAEGQVHDLTTTSTEVAETAPPRRRRVPISVPRRSPPAPQPEHVEPPAPAPEVASATAETPPDPDPPPVAVTSASTSKPAWATLLDCIEAKLEDSSINCDN